jgi:hypothetical protein
MAGAGECGRYAQRGAAWGRLQERTMSVSNPDESSTSPLA